MKLTTTQQRQNHLFILFFRNLTTIPHKPNTRRMRLLPKKWTRGKFLGGPSTGRVAASNAIVIRHSDASHVNLIESAMMEDFGVAEEIKDGGGAMTVHKAPGAPLSCAGAKKKPTAEEGAAVKIQAVFRGHLARRAFGALRSLVKLQALVRGASVRRQSRLAFHCMHAMVRLQVRVRARQLLIQHVN